MRIRPEQVAGGDQQDEAEDVEHPGEAVDQGGAQEDEAGAGDQGKDNAEQEYLLLVCPGDLEAGHDDQEHEEVVHGQGLLRDIAGEVFRAHGGAAEDQHAYSENQGEAHVDRRPRGRLPELGGVRLADVKEEVEGQQAHNPDNGQNPYV
ncbi:hypothetical protein D9M72_453640 [compost metagenome]